MRSKARQERSLVVNSLDESMLSVTIGLHGGNNHSTIFVLQSFWWMHANCASFNGFVIDADRVVNCECDVFHTIAMSGLVLAHLFANICIHVQWALESIHDFSSSYDVTACVPIACFETRVSDILESHFACVVSRRLFSVADPEADVVKAEENTDCRLFVISEILRVQWGVHSLP